MAPSAPAQGRQIMSATKTRTRVAAIYTRISKDEIDKGTGKPKRGVKAVERQEQDCRRLAQSQGYEVIVFCDRGISASRYSKKPRPAFEDMMVRAERGDFDAIIMWVFDRLMRQPKDLERLLNIVDARKHTRRPLALIPEDAEDPMRLDTPNGLYTARQLVAAAEYESGKMSKRIKSQRRQAAEEGLPTSYGGRPYGYEQDRMTVREDEAAVIREAAGRILAGQPCGRVTAWLNAEGFRTVQGGIWRTTHLRRVLMSPRIAGLVAYHGEILGRAQWPGILSVEQWQQMRDLLSLTKGRPGGGGGPLSLLSGMVFCGECGSRMVAEPKRYRCFNSTGTCGNVTRGRHALESHVITAWAKEMERRTGSESYVTELNPRPADTTEVAAEIADIEQRIEALRGDYVAGRLGVEDYTPVVNELRTRQAALQEKRDSAAVDPVTLLGEKMQAYAAAHPESTFRPEERPDLPHEVLEAPVGSTMFFTTWDGLIEMLRKFSGNDAARQQLASLIERVEVYRTTRGVKQLVPEHVDLVWR